jgi:hypothetical protein
MNKMIAHQNHIVEESNKIIEYSNYLAESINNKNENAVNESESLNVVVENETVENEVEEPIVENAAVETVEVVDEPKAEESNKIEESKFDYKKYQTELGSKLDSLISMVKTNYAEAKEKEAAALEESKSKINSTDFNLINYIPTRLQESWKNLSDERKQEILAESKMFIIKEEASAIYFWNTRDLREKRMDSIKLEENVIPNENAVMNESVLVNDSYKMMAERIKRNMRKF